MDSWVVREKRSRFQRYRFQNCRFLLRNTLIILDQEISIKRGVVKKITNKNTVVANSTDLMYSTVYAISLYWLRVTQDWYKRDARFRLVSSDFPQRSEKWHAKSATITQHLLPTRAIATRPRPKRCCLMYVCSPFGLPWCLSRCGLEVLLGFKRQGFKLPGIKKRGAKLNSIGSAACQHHHTHGDKAAAY